VPEDIDEFMRLFFQPTRIRPAVEYMPIPYRDGRHGAAARD
jgi:serine dehydrogenase proteinase